MISNEFPDSNLHSSSIEWAASAKCDNNTATLQNDSVTEETVGVVNSSHLSIRSSSFSTLNALTNYDNEVHRDDNNTDRIQFQIRPELSSTFDSGLSCDRDQYPKELHGLMTYCDDMSDLSLECGGNTMSSDFKYRFETAPINYVESGYTINTSNTSPNILKVPPITVAFHSSNSNERSMTSLNSLPCRIKDSSISTITSTKVDVPSYLPRSTSSLLSDNCYYDEISDSFESSASLDDNLNLVDSLKHKDNQFVLESTVSKSGFRKYPCVLDNTLQSEQRNGDISANNCQENPEIFQLRLLDDDDSDSLTKDLTIPNSTASQSSQRNQLYLHYSLGSYLHNGGECSGKSSFSNCNMDIFDQFRPFISSCSSVFVVRYSDNQVSDVLSTCKNSSVSVDKNCISISLCNKCKIRKRTKSKRTENYSELMKRFVGEKRQLYPYETVSIFANRIFHEFKQKFPLLLLF